MQSNTATHEIYYYKVISIHYELNYKYRIELSPFWQFEQKLKNYNHANPCRIYGKAAVLDHKCT